MRVDVRILKGYQVYLDQDGLFCVDLNNGSTISRQSYLGICNVLSGIGEEARQPRRAIIVSASYEGSVQRVTVIRQGEKYSEVRLEPGGRYCKLKGDLYEPNDEVMEEIRGITIETEAEKVRLQKQIDTNHANAVQRRKVAIAKLIPMRRG